MAGGPTEYESLIRPVEERMLRAVWRVTQDENDAEDALQEAAARIWSAIDRVRRHPTPGALVLRICVAAACDVVRRRSRRRRRERPLGGHDPGAGAAEPSDVLAAREARDRIARALARLPERQAVAVTMRYLLDSSYEEVAASLGCSEPTARVHAARGLKRLRRAADLLHPQTPAEGRR